MLITACQKYTFNTLFTVPDTLVSPDSIVLDVTSSETIELSWSGGGAADGGILLYQVLFDTPSGDFSSPLATIDSDYGAYTTLTISHAMLNTIARNAGIATEESGSIKWTVTASKGGIVKMADLSKVINVTRGEGIDNIPSQLYLYGSATENSGQGGIPFRTVEEGEFQIYTKITNGTICFKSSTDSDAFVYYADASGKLKENQGEISVSASNDVLRLTVNFNTMGVTMEYVNKEVRCIWGADYSNIAVLKYTSEGRFVGEGDIKFFDPNNPDTNPPDWLSWVEERYYFIATVDGKELCWGRGNNVSAERPTGDEDASFYALYEYTWDQWEHLWKMKGSLDFTHATITIDTNSDNMMIHSFSDITSI